MYKLPTTQKTLQIDPKLIYNQNILGNYSNWKRLWIGKDVYTKYTYTQYARKVYTITFNEKGSHLKILFLCILNYDMTVRLSIKGIVLV